ncbi:MAG: YcgN family cysteine cluster protein [Pseudomonadota bacterium]
MTAKRSRQNPALPALRKRFWEQVPLEDMTSTEWEALCDGCGRCCLLKLEDEDTGDVHYTNVSCRLFDCETRRCGNYPLRHQMVPGCVVLTPQTLPSASEWMPATCAYRRLYEGRGLPSWHPLLTGTPDSVAQYGIAVEGPLIPEYEVLEEDLEDHVLDEDWVERA